MGVCAYIANREEQKTLARNDGSHDGKTLGCNHSSEKKWGYKGSWRCPIRTDGNIRVGWYVSGGRLGGTTWDKDGGWGKSAGREGSFGPKEESGGGFLRK